MTKRYTGGCVCGAIRYETSSEPIFENHCQCRDCQKRSGTGHGSYLTFPWRADVTITGEAKKLAVGGRQRQRKDPCLLPDLWNACLGDIRCSTGSDCGPCRQPGRPRPIQPSGGHIHDPWTRLGYHRSRFDEIRANARLDSAGAMTPDRPCQERSRPRQQSDLDPLSRPKT